MATLSNTHFFIIIFLVCCLYSVECQVCSAAGHLCTRRTDCCKGCCKSNTCVESCDEAVALASVPGIDSCDRLPCPPGQACFYREVCPPETPCPRMPVCRSIDSGIMNMNSTNNNYRYYRNCAGLFDAKLVLLFTLVVVFLQSLNFMK